MVFFNYSTMQMAAKVVYYGPGLCGKTTNLQWIYDHTSNDSRGEMVSLATETDRTLFFDLLPIDVGSIAGFSTRIQLYTVPGQVFYNTTRKLVLKGVDGVVFVADSQRPMVQANIESFQNLEENLAEMGLSLDTVPVVLQYNKRDLSSICTVEEMNESLNRGNWPFCEASALNGSGVLDTLKMISKATLMALKKRLTKGRPETTMPAVKRPAVAAPAPPPSPARPAMPPPARPGSQSGPHSAVHPAAAPMPQRSTTGASTGPFPMPSFDPEPAPEPQRHPIEPVPEPASFENVFSSFELTPESLPEPVLAPVQPQPQPFAESFDPEPVTQKTATVRPATPSFAAPSFASSVFPPEPAPQQAPAPAPLPQAAPAPQPLAAPAPAPIRPQPLLPEIDFALPAPAAPSPFREVATAPLPVAAPSPLPPPAAKTKSRAGGLDALAELEKLRKEAFTAPRPAPGKSATPVADPRSGKQEISRELNLLLSRTNFNRARRFSLTVQLEDADHRPVDTARHLHVDLDDVSSLEQLLLRLHIALQSSA